MNSASEGVRKGSPLRSPAFSAAVTDYLWLLDRGYPEQRSRLLVADRYALPRPARTALLRGVFPSALNKRRAARRLSSPAQLALLSLDGNNILATLCNYLYGRSLFIATDGFLRDDGENYRPGADHATLRRAAELLERHLSGAPPLRLSILLDRSDAPSLAPAEELAAILEPIFSHWKTAELHISTTVDRELRGCGEGAIAGADSVIIDRSSVPLYDAAQASICEHFSPRLIDLRNYLPPD